ncbi:MAG: hypothetical protein EA350_15045 [Gemmatimonadales bacterium]|nr:MAG: hypothetical protein EA350_15045 [Gemmatimonadales bacterium]
MNTFALALHVVRRDLARNRWIVAGWLVLVALATLEAVRGAGLTPAGLTLRVLLVCGALFLAAGTVKVYPAAGAPPGTPAYWRTLPIPLRALLLGRVAAAVALLCGVPLVGQVLALVALDTPGSQLAGHLAASAVPIGAVVLAGLLVGSLTRGFGGAAVLVTGVFTLMFPLALARSVVGPGLGLLPPVPGITFAAALGVAGLALWMLALRHTLDPGSWWTRIGAFVIVLILVGGGQTGFLLTVSETRTWSTVRPQAGDPRFPATVNDFRLMGTRPDPTGEAPDDDASIQVSFEVAPGDGAPVPSLVLAHVVTVEDPEGRILLTRPLRAPPPRPNRPDPAMQYPEFSTNVRISIPQDLLEGLRSGALAMVVHGQGLELGPAAPLEFPLEVGARFSRAGTRTIVEEVSDAEITIRRTGFASRIPIRESGRARVATADVLGAFLLEVELLPPPGEGGGFLSRRGSSGGSFGPSAGVDMLLAGPRRVSSSVSFTAASPFSPHARLRLHVLEPTRAFSLRVAIPPDFWEREPR